MFRNNTGVRWHALTLVLLHLCLPALRASAFPPTVVLGVYGSDFLYSKEDLAREQAPGLTGAAIAGWRTALAAGGSLALNANAAMTYAPAGTAGFYDQESLEALLLVPLGGLRLEIETTLSASVRGTREGLLPYLEPSWTATGRWLGEASRIRPFVEARGFVLLERDDQVADFDDDSFYQGGALGVTLVPSFLSTYELSLEAGWQRWFEQVLFDPAGDPTLSPREDLLVQLHAGGEWLLGYFASGKLAAEGGMRRSNANRYLSDIPLLEANSESRWFTKASGGLSWSPRRELGLEAGGFLLGEWYTDRRLPAPLSGELSVLSIGADLRLDWTPDDRWYLVLDGAAVRSFSYDPEERGWNVHLQAGIELSL